MHWYLLLSKAHIAPLSQTNIIIDFPAGWEATWLIDILESTIEWHLYKKYIHK